MTRQQFIARAVRTAERNLGIPQGWWGTWRDFTNGTVRVRLRGSWEWRVTWCSGTEISRHDSRAGAIRKAAKL